MSGSVTIRDIAAATGFSRSTVSAALRGRADIAAATRELIQNAAEEMGYFQDPQLQRLMTHLRKGRSEGNRIPLALLVAGYPDAVWEHEAWNVRLWQGVQSRCEQLGFTIEVLNAEGLHQTGKQLKTVLRARGVQGVILEGSYDPPDGVGDWAQDFAGVRVGTHPWKAKFHTACPDFAYNLHLALQQVKAHGFCRPGLAMTQLHERRSDDLYLAGFLTWWARHGEGESPVPVLEYSDTEGIEFRAWLEREKPDVVLVNDHHVKKWLPAEIRPVHLNLAEDVRGWWGIDQGRERIGEAAVDILSAQFIRGETGFPEHPRSMMVRGEWVHH